MNEFWISYLVKKVHHTTTKLPPQINLTTSNYILQCRPRERKWYHRFQPYSGYARLFGDLNTEWRATTWAQTQTWLHLFDNEKHVSSKGVSQKRKGDNRMLTLKIHRSLCNQQPNRRAWRHPLHSLNTIQIYTSTCLLDCPPLTIPITTHLRIYFQRMPRVNPWQNCPWLTNRGICSWSTVHCPLQD